ncbi:MAG: EamA family transporter RarD [Planctomycetota bacterium]|nr:EamA family transporter RarD [Planctomycetota bacterium]
MEADRERRKGLVATAGAFLFWGGVPVYWKAVGTVSPEEMVGWRVLWALPFTGVLLLVLGGVNDVRAALKRPRLVGVLALSAGLVAVNWFIFIDAVARERVMETSLGYYINPLVNVLLGFVVLGERPRRAQWIAIALATVGVGVLVVAVGELPLVALALAVTFGLYGLVRKLAPVEAVPGLFIEVLLLFPLAAAWLGWLWVGPHGAAFPTAASVVQWLVPLSGFITALPLVLFAYGARRLPLTTVGILQFLAPTGQLLLAALVYREPFTTAHAVTFGLIWAAIALYLLDLRRTASRRARAVAR